MNDDLFTRFQALTTEKILAMNGEIESQRFECKEVFDPKFESRDIKRALAIYISGFSNADGGIILWGISAKKNENGIDCINGFPGVDRAEYFLSRLNELTPDAVSPGVTGIEHRIISGKGDQPTFVATLIPSSDAAPHMAMLGEKRYYQRVGHSISVMEHFQLADMFGRRPQAKLRLKIFHGPGADYLLSANLENVGRGVATAPYLLFSDVTGPYIVSKYPGTGSPGDFPLPRTRPQSRHNFEGFVGGMNDLIHPGLYLSFRVLQIQDGWTGGAPPAICSASFRYGAVGSVEQRGSLKYDFSKRIFEVLDGAEDN